MKLHWAQLLTSLMFVVIGLSAAAQSGDATPAGIWGAPNIRVEMNANGATVEFGCAHGEMLEPIEPDASGIFSVAGTFTPEHGGPIRKDETPNNMPATYKGRITGNTMHLEVVLSDKTVQPPPFNLTRGSGGKLIKCR